jgi:hypothetical protein
MNKRKKLLALMGAMVLTVGTVGIALAEPLKDAHVGITVGWDENGDPFAEDSEGNPLEVNPAACDDLVLEAGDIVFHFVQSGQGTAAGPDDTNLLDVDFTGADDQDDVVDDTVQGDGSNVDWFVWVTSAGGDVTLDGAESNVTGGELRVSHICVGDEPEVEPTPTFEATEEGETDAPTDEPTFESTEEGDTDAPSEPNTATIGGNGTSGPADGAWLLVVALGVLLASVVVMTPARAKSRR